jgi:Rrf2 family protein
MFSKPIEYALRATIFIARKASIDNKASVQFIAEGIGAPKAITAKVLQQLSKKNGGIISSVSGPSGGFYITEEAKKQPMLKVLEIMGGTAVINKCILGFPHCSDAHPCSMHHSYKYIKKEILALFWEKTIEDLATSKESLM